MNIGEGTLRQCVGKSGGGHFESISIIIIIKCTLQQERTEEFQTVQSRNVVTVLKVHGFLAQVVASQHDASQRAKNYKIASY